MPRRARQMIASTYQHIIVREIGEPVLFEARKDYLLMTVSRI